MNLYIFKRDSEQKTITMIMLIGIFLSWNINNVGAISSSIEIESNNVLVHMNEMVSIPYSVSVNDTKSTNVTLRFISNNNVATVDSTLHKQSENPQVWNGTLTVTGVFLGITPVTLEVTESETIKDTHNFLTITVVRAERLVDTIFSVSIALCVSILYINFGCALDWDMCKETIKRPVAPAIGLFCQFVFMPLMSYFIGYLAFPDNPEMQIGMFFTGISPSGGASNIYTLLFNGNLNLSITLTTLCTIFAFGTMPFWIFTLGRRILVRVDTVIPYSRISFFIVGLIVPLAIGLIIQRKYPKISKIMIRIMKPCAAVLIVFIVIFATAINFMFFKLFSFRIFIVGLSLPLAGFLFGLLVASICKQPVPNIKALSIETGIQNTGVAIFLLRFTLTPPADDLTTVIPVSISLMTPVALLILYILKVIIEKLKGTSDKTTQHKHENALDFQT